jgi:hypothetical protein
MAAIGLVTDESDDSGRREQRKRETNMAEAEGRDGLLVLLVRMDAKLVEKVQRSYGRVRPLVNSFPAM